ncbi:DUF732 domain-containing protein [Streptomyces sp. NPDC050315]|uniref:DUF732 domain-containing protein n=1 Tax=Streptomyces sp. NPDC050315 TaxID=3155039 RepID=UPI003433DC8C
MTRRAIVTAVLTLLLSTGATTLTACGDGDTGNGPPTKSTRERANDRYLSILDENAVLSTKSDAELVEVGRNDVCKNELLDGFPNFVAARLQHDDPSLDDSEADVVVQAAVKVFCPKHSDSL